MYAVRLVRGAVRGRRILADDPRKEYRPYDWYSRRAFDAPGASNKNTLFFFIRVLMERYPRDYGEKKAELSESHDRLFFELASLSILGEPFLPSIVKN